MPTQPVHDMVIHPRENDLVVATHGRGFFITDISPLQELTQDVLSADVHLFDIESKIKWVRGTSNASSSSNFSGESEPNAIVINYYLKDKVDDKVKVAVYKGNMLINEISGSSAAGINQVLWNMTVRRERTPEEKKEIQERQQRARRAGFRMRVDPNYVSGPAPVGEYKIVLMVGDKKIKKHASILQDHWY